MFANYQMNCPKILQIKKMFKFICSLNREKRQRELLRVTKENQAILKRIMLRKPEYSAQKWQREWEENQTFMDNISHFPKDWWLEEKSVSI